MKTESFDKKHKEEEDHLKMVVEEPKDWYIYTKTTDDLILESKEEMDSLLERLKNVKYDPKLAEFYSTFTNDFEDLTGL
ncbi:MAG: hypothetical protein ACTSRI_07510 [Promethearchaeota archaeon]